MFGTEPGTEYVVQIATGMLRTTKVQLWQDYQTFSTLKSARDFKKKYLAGLKPRILRRRITVVR